MRTVVKNLALLWLVVLCLLSGSAIAAQRSNSDDKLVRTAVELLRSAPSQQALFDMVETRKQAAR